MHISQSLTALAILLSGTHLLGQTTQPAVTKTIQAEEQSEPWNGWAKDGKSRPGWGNVPPEPGTVTIVNAEPKAPRTFAGRVEGLDSYEGAEVGIVTLSYIYWIRQKETFRWQPVNADGTFNMTDERSPEENKAVFLRAPGRPWTHFSYVFKAPEGGKDIVLRAEPGKRVRITADIAGKPVTDFGIERFVLNAAWKHDNNPAGYQWSSQTWTKKDSNGVLMLDLPLKPIGLYLFAQGAACEWQVVDAREFDNLHFSLMPEGRLTLTVVKDGQPQPKTPTSAINETAAFSLRGGQSNAAGVWELGGMAPGMWELTIAKQGAKLDIAPGETVTATYDLATRKFDIKR